MTDELIDTIKISFMHWLIDYESAITERWSGLTLGETDCLARRQWEVLFADIQNFSRMRSKHEATDGVS